MPQVFEQSLFLFNTVVAAVHSRVQKVAICEGKHWEGGNFWQGRAISGPGHASDSHMPQAKCRNEKGNCNVQSPVNVCSPNLPFPYGAF